MHKLIEVSVTFAMTDYTNEQKRSVVSWYEQYRSPTIVQREYRKKYGRHATVPSGATMKLWFNKLEETGSFNAKPKTRTKWARTTEREEEVLHKFEEDAHLSSRTLAREEGMPSRTTIRAILKVGVLTLF